MRITVKILFIMFINKETIRLIAIKDKKELIERLDSKN